MTSPKTWLPQHFMAIAVNINAEGGTINEVVRATLDSNTVPINGKFRKNRSGQ